MALMVGVLLPTGQASARAAQAPTVLAGTSQAAVVSSATDLAEAVPTPNGLTLVGSHVEELGGEDASEILTIAESKFNGPDRTAVTVIFIAGGNWDADAALSVGGERRASEVTVGSDRGVLVEGDLVRSIEWQRSDGIIVQIVARGSMTRDDLAAYATSVAEMGP
jgi:hypothetical protein